MVYATKRMNKAPEKREFGKKRVQASAEKIWGAAQKHLRSVLSANTYNNWFAPLRASARGANTIVLEVANDFCELWLKDNYAELLREVLGLVSGRQLRVKFRVVAGGGNRPRASIVSPEPAKMKPVEALTERNPVNRELGLNPEYTFDTFVAGNSNNFAYAAALAVAQAPGRSYNPLFLHGGAGLGKSHLLHAIGHYVSAHEKGARVCCVSSEQFGNEFIDSVQNNQLAGFRNKYRQTEVLLVEDIQFLGGKERIQEEFFHTFNALQQNQRQIVLTCDRPAGEIQNLEQRLISRFDCGLVTDLHPPDAELRLAILRHKASGMGAKLPEEIMNLLASRIRSNVRELEGALIRVASYAALTDKELSLEVVEGLLRDILVEEGRYAIRIDTIQKKVAEHFAMRLEDMASRRRPENISLPRQIAMFISRQMTETSLSAIGEAFGGRNHATVLRACQLVKDRMEVDPHLRQIVSCLEKQLTR